MLGLGMELHKAKHKNNKPNMLQGCVMYHDYTTGSAKDWSGNGNNGTVAGGTFDTTGFVGDGVDDYVEVANSASINPAQITLAIWFAPKETLGNQAVCGNGGGNSFQYGVEFGNYFSGFGLWVNGAVNMAAVTKPAANELHHWVGTYDKTSIKLYKDGVLVKTTPYTADIVPTNGRFCVSRAAIDGGVKNTTASLFKMTQMYSRALTAEEITQLYNTEKTKFGL